MSVTSLSEQPWPTVRCIDRCTFNLRLLYHSYDFYGRNLMCNLKICVAACLSINIKIWQERYILPPSSQSDPIIFTPALGYWICAKNKQDNLNGIRLRRVAFALFSVLDTYDRRTKFHKATSWKISNTKSKSAINQQTTLGREFRYKISKCVREATLS